MPSAPLTPEGRLVRIRHGATEWSESGRRTGRTDVSLTVEGEAREADLAPVLERRDVLLFGHGHALRVLATVVLRRSRV